VATPTDVDELYGLPLEEFTAARNALAKEVGRQGDKAGAAEIKRLPKPSKTAWALNQLARRDAAAVEELLESGERLRAAQQQALEGDASRLREATRAEQDQVNRLVDAALAILGADGGAAEERIRRTLRAAANDPDVGELLRRGRLVADVETSGFGLDAFFDLALADRPVRRPAERPGSGEGKGKDEDQEAERARAEAERQAEARRAAREAERLQKVAHRAHERASRMIEEAEAAERRAREARRAADQAVAAAEEAQRQADEAVSAL
jgi:hypothetical protein